MNIVDIWSKYQIFPGIGTNFLDLMYFSLPKNHLVQLSLTKNSQTFSVESENKYKGTVKVSTHESYHNNLDK